MHVSDRFQQLMTKLANVDGIEPAKRRRIQAGLEYFKRQLLCEADRKDPDEKILASWKEFHRLIKGSRIFASLEKDKGFWKALESSVGVPHVMHIDDKPFPKRAITTEEFFLQLAADAERIDHSGEQKLILFALWYLSVEARLAKPFRSQKRIEMVYRYIHPRLKFYGFLKRFENNKEVESLVKYFIKGSIY